MILAALGLVVLAVSFAIALVSLIREQKISPSQTLNEPENLGGDGSKTLKSEPKEDQGVPKFAGRESGRGVQQPLVVNADKHDRQEPFPWEIDAREIKDLDLEREKEGLGILPNVKVQNMTPVQEHEGKKLSGGFSLRDLPKASD